MDVRELDRDQLVELKQNHLCETQGSVSWGELIDADEIVSDEEIYEAYEGTDFVPDDFFCSCSLR